jgi:hypothetical protein
MLAQDTAFCFGVPNHTDATEQPSDGLKNLLSQIEAELYRSDVFRRAIASLEETQKDEAASVQFLLKSIGREAIRLALRQFVQSTGQAQALERAQSLENAAKKATPVVQTNGVQTNRQEPELSIQKANRSDASEEFDPQLLNLVPGWRKRSGVSQQAEQEQQERQLGLSRLGQQIRKAREARSMSLSELHTKTLVPLHQLQAIEAGHGVHLPEDIYLRGFIRRIAKALDLKAEQLLDLVPTPDPVKAILPSWYHPPTKTSSISLGNMALRPAHLYVGYAALLAGGVAWLSHQPSPAPLPNAIDLSSPRVTTPSPRSQADQSAKVSVNSSVAAPEVIR